jgi:hypothetical protein
MLTRVVRQFHLEPGVVGQLAADFTLPDTPTMGTYLALAHVLHLLRVVSVVLRPRAEPGGVGVVVPPGVVAFTEYEPAVSFEEARGHGWEPVPGLPQPPQAA